MDFIAFLHGFFRNIQAAVLLDKIGDFKLVAGILETIFGVSAK